MGTISEAKTQAAHKERRDSRQKDRLDLNIYILKYQETRDCMPDKRTIIAIDQGTTSSRAILFDEDGVILAQKSAEFPKFFPKMAGSNMTRRPYGRPRFM